MEVVIFIPLFIEQFLILKIEGIYIFEPVKFKAIGNLSKLQVRSYWKPLQLNFYRILGWLRYR